MKPLEDLFELYDRAGDADYIGEPISQLEHMQQAAWLAQQASEILLYTGQATE